MWFDMISDKRQSLVFSYICLGRILVLVSMCWSAYFFFATRPRLNATLS